MTDGPEIEIVAGQTYEMRSLFAVPGAAPRRVIAERHLGGGMWKVRAANGLDSQTFANYLTGPVEPLRPGVEEPCLLCRGEKVVPIDAPEHLDRPWSRVVVGYEACRNCGGGTTDVEIRSTDALDIS